MREQQNGPWPPTGAHNANYSHFFKGAATKKCALARNQGPLSWQDSGLYREYYSELHSQTP